MAVVKLPEDALRQTSYIIPCVYTYIYIRIHIRALMHICIYVYVCVCFILKLFETAPSSSPQNHNPTYNTHELPCSRIWTAHKVPRIGAYTISTCVYIYIQIYTCNYLCTHVHTHISVYIYVCVYIHVYIFKCIHACVCVPVSVIWEPGGCSPRKKRKARTMRTARKAFLSSFGQSQSGHPPPYNINLEADGGPYIKECSLKKGPLWRGVCRKELPQF